MTLHFAFEANDNQQHSDLHQDNPSLLDILQYILTNSQPGLSLFGLNHCRDHYFFVIIDERLSLDEHLFNGGWGNVVVSDMITEDRITGGGTSTPSAIIFNDNVEPKVCLPAQDISRAFFHNPPHLICLSLISNNNSVSGISMDHLTAVSTSRTHVCSPTNAHPTAAMDSNAIQASNAADAELDELVADVIKMI